MLKFTADFEWHDKKAVQLQLEHIGNLIVTGQVVGDGWQITGESEQPVDKEPEIEPDTDFPDETY